jgi:adenylate kinase family enzyme
MRLIILAPPGAGKSAYATPVAERFGPAFLIQNYNRARRLSRQD